MITTQLLTQQHDIERVLPECIDLAKKTNARLPFQYMHMPLAWWETFKPEDDELFSVKRGKNFLGVQSRLEKFFLLTARCEDELCGVAPLVQFAIKIPASKDEIHIITFAGDYVLHPFQDLVVDPERRLQIVTAILTQVSAMLGNEISMFWAGYIPEESPNLGAMRGACSSLKSQGMENVEAVSFQRGGVWPWTLNSICATLKGISSVCEKSGKNIEGLSELTAKIEKCTPQSLLFPRTRASILNEIQDLLSRIKPFDDLSVPAEKLNSLLINSPMLYPYIELPRDREEYLMSLSYSTRRYFRRYMKKYFEAGGSFEAVLPNEINNEDIQDYIRLHLMRWGDGSAAICGNAADYHGKISRAMAEQGLFILFFAVYKGRRIAVHSCFDIAARREGYITGLDPEYHELRAGRLLYLHTIYDAIDRGLERYELGAVGFDYKMSFVKKTAVAHNFFLYPAGKGAMLDQVFTGFECMEPLSF